MLAVARRSIVKRAATTAVRAMSTAAETPSFTKGLFAGEIRSEWMHPFPAYVDDDTRETLSMLIPTYERFLDEACDAEKNDATGTVPDELMASLREMGAYGLQVPEEYGGLGLNNTAYARAVEVIGARDLGLGIHLGAHQSIGYKGILLFGTPEQKEKYLPSLASGETVAAFSLTEPGAGSDAASVQTRATRAADGSGWEITGQKIWSSNGPIAGLFTVFARTEVPDPKNPGQTKDKMSAFIVERAFGGVETGPKEQKLGIRCSPTGTVYLDKTPVPDENVLLQPGDGFKVAMEILNTGRHGMSAALAGTQKRIIAEAAAHVTQRRQFGAYLSDFDAVKGAFASMTARTYATEAMAYALAGNMDKKSTGQAVDTVLEAAAAKVFASDAAWTTIDQAVQAVGGIGFMAPSVYERFLRDSRIFRIFEGANGILTQFVALTSMKDVGAAMKKAGAGNALTLLRDRVGMPEVPTMPAFPGALGAAGEAVAGATAQLAAVTREALVKHGKGIMTQQFINERLGASAIQLTAATAALSRAAASRAAGLPTADHEEDIACMFAHDAAAMARQLTAQARPSSGADVAADALRRRVADAVFEGSAYIAKHPIDV